VLGRFLELSLATPDIQASLDFYVKLGFSQAEVGDAWPHPYAVVTDGRVHLGLHQAEIPAPSMTFVKPDLLKHLGALESLGVEFEFRRLGNDVFNEVGWLDPSGRPIEEAIAFQWVGTTRYSGRTQPLSSEVNLGLGGGATECESVQVTDAAL
jgi:catechol 2,3-dioxygenase-like lactoylglutathione lyase family enzyme